MQVKLFLLLASTIIIVLMFPRGETLEKEVMVGTIWIEDDLIANINFPILKKPETYRIELERARLKVLPIFVKSSNLETQQTDSLKSFTSYLTSYIDTAKANNRNLPPVFFKNQTLGVFQTLREAETGNGGFVPSQYTLLMNYSAEVLKSLFAKGVLSLNFSQIERDSIFVQDGNIQEAKLKSGLIPSDNITEEVRKAFKKLELPEDVAEAFTEYLTHFAVPNLIYSPELTQQQVEIEQNKVSKFSGLVAANERIVAKHERITPDIKLKIDSYKAAKGDSLGLNETIMQFTGKFLHVFSLLVLLSIHLYVFRKKIFADNLKLSIFAILLTVISFITNQINSLNINDSAYLLIFVPAVSMLLTIMFDSRVGFYNTVIVSLICGGLRGNDYTFAVMNIVASSLAVYTVRDIKNRTQIFRSFGFILLGYVVSIIFFKFEALASWSEIWIELAFASTNALISPVLTYGLLIIFERFFKVTTDLTLLELSNFDRPLLRELARTAPGTFNHSITVGTLAESAAEAVEGNPLLARVGAYYHDIGKTRSPYYYVENQMTVKNLHEDITPLESVKIILDHVQYGELLAKENNLPAEVIDFIPTHHGTSLISYFYDKAVKEQGAGNVNQEDFRYKGKKPYSKETAILMLADSCESATRSIENPTPEKIENMVNALIDKKIQDNQLNESPLTFSDIDKIKKTFVQILIGQRHRRIKYPQQEQMETQR